MGRVSGNWREVGKCARIYWEQKKEMAPGCEPEAVKGLVESLYVQDLIEAGWLAGAGGGGFLYLLLKDHVDASELVDSIPMQQVGFA